MRTSTSTAVEDGEILYTIGTIRASSGWYGHGAQPLKADWEARVLAELVRRAEDIYADAIVEISFTVDTVDCMDEGFGLRRHRLIGTAVAVKLSAARKAA